MEQEEQPIIESFESKLVKARDGVSESILFELSFDESIEIRCEVANSLNTPRFILEKMSTDVNEEVRSGISTNPNTRPLTQRK